MIGPKEGIQVTACTHAPRGNVEEPLIYFDRAGDGGRGKFSGSIVIDLEVQATAAVGWSGANGYSHRIVRRNLALRGDSFFGWGGGQLSPKSRINLPRCSTG